MPSTTKSTRPDAAAGRTLFTTDQVTFLAKGLASRDHEVRSGVRFVLRGLVPAGLDLIFAEIRNAPERQALDLLDGLFGQRKSASLSQLTDRCVALLETEERPRVREALLHRVIRTEDIGVSLLREALVGEDDQIRGIAAGQLVRRGRAGLDILTASLRSTDRDVQELARDAVFAFMLRSDTEEDASAAWKQLRTVSEEGAYPSLFDLIESVVAARGTSSARRATGRSSSTRTSSRYRSGSYRSKTTWPRAEISGNVPIWRERYALFLPFLAERLEQGAAEEKERAEAVLMSLAREAVNEKRLLEMGGSSTTARRYTGRLTSRARTTSSARPAPTPTIDRIHSPAELAQRLNMRAQQARKEKDWPAYVAGMRRALAADPTHVNSADHLAWFLATTDMENLADPEEAERVCRETIKRTDRHQALLACLAASLARQGRFDEAVKIQFETLAKTDNDGKARQLERLAYYQEKKPYIVKR